MITIDENKLIERLAKKYGMYMELSVKSEYSTDGDDANHEEEKNLFSSIALGISIAMQTIKSEIMYLKDLKDSGEKNEQ